MMTPEEGPPGQSQLRPASASASALSTSESAAPLGPDGQSRSKKESWVKRTAGSISNAGRVASSTIRRPTNIFKKTSSKDRSTVNPISLAATKAQAETRKQLREDEQQASAGLPAGSGDDGTRRTIVLAGEPPDGGFCSNKVVTAKYNVLTFLPKFLLEMFSRVAYLYFLLQASLSWWSTISPFGGWGATLALTFVLVVGGIKALWEDHKRHQEDRLMNRSTAHMVLPDGSVKDVYWTDVQVGHLILVKDDELFPADLMCMHSALPDNVCFIKTTNLDGETNLKIRKPLDLRGVPLQTSEDAVALRGHLSLELPSANLHHLKATFTYKSPDGEDRRCPVTMNEMLLRGCMLKNSRHVIGLVVYTGPESRIQMNAAKTPLKVGSFDRFLNLQIILVVAMQLTMCFFHSIMNVLWRQNTGYKRYYMGWDYNVNGNYSSEFVYWFIMFMTFWILYSYLVPISLFVTMEIVKFWQGFVFINADKDMRDPHTKEWARCRNSGLNEDLGKVEYVFSDKTGTLTANEMQLRMIAVKGVAYGTMDWRLEEHRSTTGMPALRTFDRRLAEAMTALNASDEHWGRALHAGGSTKEMLSLPKSKGGMVDVPLVPILDMAPGSANGQAANGNVSPAAPAATVEAAAAPAAASAAMPRTLRDPETALVLGHHLLDFWTNICLCHSLIVEPDPAGGPAFYQGPSPDEVSLVEAARQLGFEFVARSMSNITLNMQGHEVKHEILNVMEFSSDRGRMSVMARAPDGTVRLYCKGSDAALLGRLRPDTDQALIDETNRNLHLFATQGLRTLLLGTRVVPDGVFAEWDVRYQEAASDIDNRETLIAELADELEQGLELVGVTAIEDKLQDGVPEAIQSLLDANVKVWMITGDKQETAINIGISCKLIHKPDNLLVCNGTSYQEAQTKMQELQDRINLLQAESAKGMPQVGELVIDGKTLSYVLGSDLEEVLAEVGAACGSVIICRASPAQKAAVVKMMMEYELKLAAGTTTGLRRWLRRYNKRMSGKMLGIGDGANDVAMIQVADIGVGIMGKEGRQAVNNSDYAFSQFRFLIRLLLVHGTLSQYRLARLIKYSFYKNITFAFVLFWFQFFCGYSGQTLIDGIPAAVYNVIFTSMPVLLFSVLDRPVKHLTTLMRYPQLYNKQQSLTTANFWRSGVLLAIVDAVMVFFIPYFAMRTDGQSSVTDVYSLGKVVYVGLLGVITLEVALVARYWTWLFFIFVMLSYFLCYVFFLLYPVIELWWNVYDPAWYGQPYQVLSTGYFWLTLLVLYASTFGLRYLHRTFMWLYRPQDTMILTEKEALEGPLGGDMTWQARRRLSSLVSVGNTNRPGPGSRPGRTNGGGGYSSSSDEEDSLGGGSGPGAAARATPAMSGNGVSLERVSGVSGVSGIAILPTAAPRSDDVLRREGGRPAAVLPPSPLAPVLRK